MSASVAVGLGTGSEGVTGDPAAVRDRCAAAAIDLLPILVALVAALVVWTATPWPGWAALALVGLAVAWTGVLLWGSMAGGRSVGKRARGVREVVEATGAAPGPALAVGRWLLRGALVLVTVGVAGLSYRWDPAGRERTWWDRLTGTAVVPDGAAVESAERAAARWAPGGDGDGFPVAPPRSGGGWVPSSRTAASAAGPGSSGPVPSAPVPSAPVPSALGPIPHPPGPTVAVPASAPATRDDGPAFLAKPLIGDGSRMVPVERETAFGDEGSDPGAGSPEGLITGIADTGAPIVGGAVPAGPVARPPSPARREWPAPPPSPAPPGARHRAAPAPTSPSPQGFSSPTGPPSPSAPSSPPGGPLPIDPLRTVRIRAAEAELVWDTGRHVMVAGRVLIGREPAPAEGEHADHVLPVSTDSVGVSKTHLQLDIGRDGITVTDRRSTNGVRLAHPDGSVDRCPPGEPVIVEPGDVVHFGGRHITLAR